MEAAQHRNIKDGRQYDHLFPKAGMQFVTTKKHAGLEDTLRLIPKVVRETLSQTKGIAAVLKTNSVYESCKNIWEFVYGHIRYKKDAEGYEQVRSPGRAWADRFTGVDCDCYSVFISSILTNLNIPHKLRVTKYRADYYQHIYPVAISPSGKEIILDCVTDAFDYEVPYSAKKELNMELQYLNGFDGIALYHDPNDTYWMQQAGSTDGMEELGKVIKRNMQEKKKPAAVKTNQAPVKAVPGKKVLNKINKANPPAALVRSGILASMKLNSMNVAQRLRWSYLTDAAAAAKGIDPVKFQKLKQVRQRLEKLFYNAGGKPENLKQAILQGKGNKDKGVNGINYDENDYNDINDGNDDIINDYSLIGVLGEPATATALAAASGVIAAIAGLLKNVGDIFPKKQGKPTDFENAPTAIPSPVITNAAEQVMQQAAVTEAAMLPPVLPQQSMPQTQNIIAPELPFVKSGAEIQPGNELPAANNGGANISKLIAENNNELPANNNAGSKDNGVGEKESFWDKNKKWLKPTALGVGGLTVLLIGYRLLKPNPSQNKASPSKRSNGLSGTKSHRRRHGKKKAVALS